MSMSMIRAVRTPVVDAAKRGVATTVIRYHDGFASPVPVDDRTGPSAVPYGDKNVMLGKNGKLIPKLPKGTRVGKLIMGDHGMYNPDFRAKQLRYLKAQKMEGSWGEVNDTPAGAFQRIFVKVLAVACGTMLVLNIASILNNELVFPYSIMFGKHKSE